MPNGERITSRSHHSYSSYPLPHCVPLPNFVGGREEVAQLDNFKVE